MAAGAGRNRSIGFHAGLLGFATRLRITARNEVRHGLTVSTTVGTIVDTVNRCSTPLTPPRECPP